MSEHLPVKPEPCRWHFFAGWEFDTCPDCGWSGRKAKEKGVTDHGKDNSQAT